MARILVVDDNEDIRFIYNKVLTSKGYLVDSAANGKEAMEKFRSNVPDLTIMDSKLPDSNGLDVIQEIIEIEPDAKILGATGYSDVGHKFMEAGALKVLEKPFTLEELIDIVTDILEK